MNNLFKKLRFALVIVLLLSIASANVVLADGGKPPPPTPVVIRQGGPVVHSEPAVPIGDFLLSAATVYRAGWTDAYWVWYYPANIEHHGSHNSQSDLVENNIWADGNLKVKGVVVNSCSSHTGGQYTHCETSKTYYLKYSITAKSWHYFHTSGYVDQNFTTSKTINP